MVDRLIQLLFRPLYIGGRECPYLTRFHVFRCRWFRVFVHRIYLPDKDRDLHNHPWPKALAVILRGGYFEIRQDGQYREHNAGEVNILEGSAYHRIAAVYPNTWTLFIAGRRTREWGFLVDGKHVEGRKYLGLPPDHDFGD